MGFTLYPALDILDNQVVRLKQGDYNEVTVYSGDAVALATEYEAAGATHLHVVDLAAAKSGVQHVTDVVAELRAATNLVIQVGGGIRNEENVAITLEAGADRVVVGSTAVHDSLRVQDWIATYGPDRIVVALDVRPGPHGQWHPATNGWTEQTDFDIFAITAKYEARGLRHLLVTDITRDGMLTGANNTLYSLLSKAFPNLAVQASGGVKDLTDIPNARTAGCGGIVLGKALLERRFTLQDALKEASA